MSNGEVQGRELVRMQREEVLKAACGMRRRVPVHRAGRGIDAEPERAPRMMFPAVMPSVLYQLAVWLTHWGFPKAREVGIDGGEGEIRHAIGDYTSRGL